MSGPDAWIMAAGAVPIWVSAWAVRTFGIQPLRAPRTTQWCHWPLSGRMLLACVVNHKTRADAPTRPRMAASTKGFTSPLSLMNRKEVDHSMEQARRFAAMKPGVGAAGSATASPGAADMSDLKPGDRRGTG